MAKGFTYSIEKMLAGSPVENGLCEWMFFRSYVGAALWSSSDESDESGGEPLDRNYDISDFDAESLRKLATNCALFYDAHKEHIHCEGAPLASDYDGPISAREASQAGHDFWLDHNGHGCGFWDGEWPEPAAAILTIACESVPPIDLYVHDGKVYV